MKDLAVLSLWFFYADIISVWAKGCLRDVCWVIIQYCVVCFVTQIILASLCLLDMFSLFSLFLSPFFF